MAYQVVKTIKGKKYLYAQSTYREGGKVKTVSHYIGAVDPQTGVLIEPSDHPDHPRPHNTADQIEQVLAEKHPPEPLLKFKLKEHCKISIPSLKNEYQEQLTALEKYGIDPEKFPPVTIKHGSKYSHYKPALKNELVITAPKNGFNREELRTEYRKSLHQNFIEILEREAPEKLYPFKYAFDKSYRQTQDALTKYLFNSNSKNRFYKILALKFFNMMNPVPTGKRTQLDPTKIGLMEYGKREDWKAEYATVMTAIDKHGIKKIHAKASEEINKARAGQRKTIEKKTIFFMRKRKTVKRLQARIEANQELIKKLNLIKQYRLG